MIKVLYLLNHAGKAGTERYVQSLTEKLNTKKIKAYFAYNEDGLLVNRLKDLGVETYNINMKNPFDIIAAKKVADLCKKLDIQIIHTQFLRENYIAILSKMFNPNVKVIYTNHFIMKNNFSVRVTNKILTRFDSQIISVCNKGKEVMISNKVQKDIIKVIFNGVDVGYWSEPIKSTLRSEFNISDDEFIFLCCSRFAHDKGHDFLIDALAELKKISNKRFKCVLSNDGPLIEKCKQQVNDLNLNDNVIFTGFRQDVKNLIYGCDFYINSSEHEALSFAIIEVLACNIPVVAADIGGNRDIINENTNCGILVKYGDSKALGVQLKKVMDDGEFKQKLKDNSLKTATEVFNLNKMIDETYETYQTVIDK